MTFLLDDESLTSANLRNDHRFITKEYSLHFHWYVAFWEAQSKALNLVVPIINQRKAMRAYAQSGQYHIIVKIPDS